MQNYPRKLCHTTGWNKNMKSKLSLVYLGTNIVALYYSPQIS